MTVVPTRLAGPEFLTNSIGIIYTCPPNTIVFLQACNFANTDTGTHLVQVYVVPSGIAVTSAELVVPNQGISPQATYQSAELAGVVLAAGDSIQAIADANSVVNVTLNGFVLTSSGT